MFIIEKHVKNYLTACLHKEQEKAEKSALSTAKYLWNFLTGMAVKHNISMQAAA